MSVLPESWGLKTKRRNDGKLDIIGKDDLGFDYKARTTETCEVTFKDIAILHEADREAYKSRDEGARSFTKSVTDANTQMRKVEEDRFENDLIEAAGPVVRAGLEREGATSRYSRKFLRNFEKVKW